MIPWYRQSRVRIALHIAGLAILGSAYLEGARLCSMVHGHPGAEASPGECLLAGLMILSASFGSALTVIGGGLWKPVRVSDRWTARRS
jgi:hypothetical protein